MEYKLMMKNNGKDASAADSITQPFFYEIRVRGRLSEEQWEAWFDNLTIATTKGESVLKGSLPDHSALYGLLARLRDLAIPLLAVNVLDAEAQRKLHTKSRRYDLLIDLLVLLVYLLKLGGLTTITVLLTSDGILNTALALSILFALLGGLAFAFSLWSRKKVWRWVAYFLWPASVLTFLIFIAVTEILPAALAIGIILFYVAGGMFYLLYFLRGRAELLNDQIVEWESYRSETVSEVEGLEQEEAEQDDPDH
jgi:hypothetical protein